jgi:phage shock protein PspC (stress-responsive transcriptional regulator)
MNRVTIVNLNGNAYQLEEDGYEALRAYLENAARLLAANPDKDEIVADIERAIADKFRTRLGPNKTVILGREVAAILAEMGPVQDPAAEPASAAAGAAEPAPGSPEGAGGGAPKRLYRLREDAMIAGVCNGLGAYLGVDVTVVRLAFVLLAAVTLGVGLFVYAVLAFVVPAATTSAEKTAATGIPSTAEEFIRRARAGYYTHVRSFQDRRARREWKRRFKRDLHQMANRWRCEWHDRWSAPAGREPGPAVTAPFTVLFASLILAALGILLILALVSLLSTHALFGVALPAGLPLWAGLLIVIIVFHCVAWPFKAMRHAAWWHGYPAFPIWDGLVWLAFLCVVIWLLRHHSPEVRHALNEIPPTLHQMAASLRHWWSGK